MKNNAVDSYFKNHIASMISGAMRDVKQQHPEFNMNPRAFGSIAKRLSGMLIGNVLNEIRQSLKEDDVYNTLKTEVAISQKRQASMKKQLDYWMNRCKELEEKQNVVT